MTVMAMLHHGQSTPVTQYTHVYGNSLDFNLVVYGTQYTGMQCAMFSFAVEGGVCLWKIRSVCVVKIGLFGCYS